jgi:hypothetical protein
MEKLRADFNADRFPSFEDLQKTSRPSGTLCNPEPVAFRTYPKSKSLVVACSRQGGLPRDARLGWIFTGRDGGFTIELSRTLLRVYQRYYDSYGLIDSHTTNPERLVQEPVAMVPGEVYSVTVILDAHFSQALPLGL